MFFAPVLRTRSVPSSRILDPEFTRFFENLGFNATQDEKFITLTRDLPGVAREDLVITVEGVLVHLETKAEAKRQYKATYEVAEEIDAEGTSAELKDGVLTLKLAKKVPVSNARTIEVK